MNRVEVVPVTAEELDGAAHDEASARSMKVSRAFTGYQQRATGRRLPVIRLVRRTTPSDTSASA